MKKKLFTLLTLLLNVCSGAWAQTVYECYYNGSSTVNTSTYFSTENTLMGSGYNNNMTITFTNNNGDEIKSSKFTKLTNGKGVNFTVTTGYTASVSVVAVTKDKTSGNGIMLKKKNGDNWEKVETYTTNVPTTTYTRYTASFSSLTAGEYRMERNSQENAAVYVKVVETIIANYNITWAAGGHGTAPTSPTSASSFTLPTMEADGVWNNTGWTANQTVKVGGVDKTSGTFLAVGTSVTLTAATTFTGVWQQPSTFALTSDAEVELTVGGGTSQIAYENAAATVTYESANTSVATVDEDGKITAVAGGKTTITVTDPGTTTVAAGNATVTVLVPYDNPAAADTYTLTHSEHAFSNDAQTTHYFTNGFTITTNGADGMQYAAIESNNGIKYSHVRTYTINTPSNVTATYLEIEARNNYATGGTAANWGTVLGTDYSSENLPYSDKDPQTKYFQIASPAAGSSLAFSPGGNQWQGYITVHTNAWVAATGVSLNKTSASIEEGDTETLTATIAPATASNKNVTWTSSDTDVATVSGGVVKAVAAGTATITATTEDGSFTATCTVTVVTPATPIVTMPTASRDGYTSSLASSDISGSGYTMNDQKAYSVSNGGSFTIIVPSTTNVSKIRVIGTSADNSNASTVTITGANSESASATMNLRKAASVTTFDFVPTTQTTTYTIQSANKGSYLQIAIYGTENTFSTKSGRNYATFVTNAKLDFASADGITAYIATGLNAGGTAVVLQSVDVVPANTPIIVKTDTKGATVTVDATDKTASDVTSNALVAGDGTTAWNGTANTTYYYLASDLFHEANDGTLQSGKAYLAITSASARTLSIAFDDNLTGISDIRGEKEGLNGDFFDMQGRKIAQPTRGLYIVNGKKVVIK